MSKPVSHKLSALSVLYKTVWERYKERAGTFSIIILVTWAAMISLAVALFMLFSIGGVASLVGAGVGGGSVEEVLPRLLGVGLPVLILLGLVGFLAYAAINTWMSAAMTMTAVAKKPLSFSEAWKGGWKHFWPFVWISLLIQLITFGGSVLLIIPGIFLTIALIFATYVYFEEGQRGFAAIIRSRDLVKGYWWAVFGRTLLAVAGLYLAAIAMIVVFKAFDADWVASLLIQFGTWFVAVPMLILMYAELYKELVKIKGVHKPVVEGRRWKYVILIVLGIILPIVWMVLLGAAAATFFFRGVSDGSLMYDGASQVPGMFGEGQELQLSPEELQMLEEQLNELNFGEIPTEVQEN